MKARVPISNQWKKRILQEAEKNHNDHTRRTIKIMCSVLNDEFGFGKQRLMKVLTKVFELSEKRDKDEIFWWHIDNQLERAGIEFEKEDYELMDR